MDKATLITNIKNIVPRQPADIDNVIDVAINTGVELFGRMIEAIYDHDIWRHTIDSTDVNNNVDNWQLPARTKRILSAALIDTSQTENIEIPLAPASPKDHHSVGELALGVRRTPTFAETGWAFQTSDYLASKGRGTYRKSGRPEIYWRVAKNVWVYPRPNSDEINNIIEIVVARRPPSLTNSGDTNTISDEFPYALIHYSAALVWFHFGQESRGRIELQIAAKLLEEVATDEELQKLLQVDTMYLRRR